MMKKAPASPIGEMSIMDSSGHKELKWHPDNPGEAAIAKETFDKLLGEGYSAFASPRHGETKRLIDQFDSTMEEVIMVPRNVAG
jgi:hypothetical protein